MNQHNLTMIACGRNGHTGREDRVRFLLVLIALLGLIDLVVTLTYMRTTGMIEANPFVVQLVRLTGSTLPIVAFKTATMLAGLGLIHGLRRHVQAELAAWLMAAVFLGVCVAWVLYGHQVDDLELVALAELAGGDGWVRVQ